MKKVVVVGGGTGSYTVLRGLKKYSSDVHLTAIISMFDSGGSTGILRDELGILPPGDIRRALIALGDTDLMRKVFKYRFTDDKKHNLGNLILTALGDIAKDEALGYKLASKLLNVSGDVLPVTVDHSDFVSVLEDGRVIKGEGNFNESLGSPVASVRLEPKAKIYGDCKEVISSSDMIVIGPGSLYTSIVSNFLVEGFSDAIKSSNALKVYVCNIMTQPGETLGFSVSQHVQIIEEFLGKGVIDLIIVNNKMPSEEALSKYKELGSNLVYDDSEILNYKVVKADLLYEPDLIRHNRIKLAKLLVTLLEGAT